MTESKTVHLVKVDHEGEETIFRVYSDGDISLSRGNGREDFVYLHAAQLGVLKAVIAEAEKCTQQ